jgi:exodeoxyribonuclease V beta subunit
MIDERTKELENRFLVLEANAGSGKTFSLVSRYLALLFLGVKPDKIFALTFTKKATKEMYDRVISSLKNPKKSGEVTDIGSRLGLKETEILQKSEEALNLLLNSDIKISTIDSFTNAILKKFSHHLDILPSFRVVERIDEVKFREIFVKNLELQEGYRNALLQLQRYDKKIKIDGILNELENLYRREIETYDLVKRVSTAQITTGELQSDENYILELSNLIRTELLGTEKLSKSGENALEFLTFEDLLKKGWLSKDSLVEYRFFKKAKPSETLELVFEKLQNSLQNYFQNRRILLFQNFFQLFEFYKNEREDFIKREQKFSFDDINHFLVKLLTDKNIDSRFIYFRLDSTVEHFLIDEFQDTSILQYRVLEPLIDDILSGGSEGLKSFFYVGDKMQSLYRFRGGFSHLFDFIQDEYPIIKRQTLPKNYRSQKSVVDFVNLIFGTKQELGRGEKQFGGFVEIKEVEKSLENSISEVEKLISYGVNPDHIAVICNKNSEIDWVAEALQERGIMVEPESNLALTDYPPVKAITQYLLFLYYRNHERSLYYLKNFQTIVGISPNEKIETFPNVDLKRDSLHSIAIEIVSHFELFDGDENSLHFIDSLSQYADIDEFIFNYHLQGGKVVKNSKHGVNITTVHKSKGLEYRFVILLDSSGRGRAEKMTISYSGVDALDIFWSLGEKENALYRRYGEAKEGEKALETEDSINRLYVAFTRAKSGLIVLKNREKSSLDILEKLETRSFGDRENTLEKYRKEESGKTVQKEIEEFYFPDDEPYYGTQRENLEVDESEIEEINLGGELDSFRKKEFGMALHSTIEMIDDFSEEALYIAIENIRNRYFLEEEQLVSIRRRVEKLIENREFQKFISEGEIDRERGYFYQNRNYFMDMVIEKSDEVTVLDFKSSDNSQFEDKYQKQVSKYMEILGEVEKKRVRGYLLFLSEKETEIREVRI